MYEEKLRVWINIYKVMLENNEVTSANIARKAINKILIDIKKSLWAGYYASEDRFLVNGKYPPFDSIYVLIPERYLGGLEDLIEYYNSTL
jgi:hypothetical protein